MSATTARILYPRFVTWRPALIPAMSPASPPSPHSQSSRVSSSPSSESWSVTNCWSGSAHYATWKLSLCRKTFSQKRPFGRSHMHSFTFSSSELQNVKMCKQIKSFNPSFAPKGFLVAVTCIPTPPRHTAPVPHSCHQRTWSSIFCPQKVDLNWQMFNLFQLWPNFYTFSSSAISRGCSKAPALARRGHYNR